ncbi:MAG TPA: HAMP domain-containing sensor histidine kinase [Acidimicrobiales bacterium]|nr:HAMP domain-containing sensor histidine kinase [Acidimicrobiales bacterium]
MTAEGEGEVTAALAALNVARGRFIAVVGHELRTPVTTLRGLAEQLEGADAETVRDLTPALVRNARRVESLLDDLLLATDITTVLPVGEPERIDLVSTAQAIWDAFEEDAELVLSGTPEADVDMRPGAADTMLERVLDNARRYGRAPFRLHADQAGDRVRLVIASEGPELVPDDVHLAFELFYRGEAAVTSAPGFGLGLPVARALARQDGGELTIEPREGGGLDVCIDLPAAT